MKKCPYCGWEGEDQQCKRCKAMIPSDQPKEEQKDEPLVVRKKSKESE